MREVTMMEELQGIANCCECEATEKRLNVWIKKASAAPEQESVAWMVGKTVWENRSAAVRHAADRMLLVRPLYTHSDDGELERLRAELESRFTVEEHERLVAKRQELNRAYISKLEQKMAEAQALLARVINSGALTCEQYSELEADICAAVDVVTVLKRLEFKEHLAKCAEEVAAMPTYKRECLKSPAALSATAQPAEVKS